jgi:uncharacterized Zn finger protein (UPF0148 family)
VGPLVKKVAPRIPQGDEPPLDIDYACVNCGEPGSMCQQCGNVFCINCNKNPHIQEGHEPAGHLTPPEPEPETELQRLKREHWELLRELEGTPEEQMRRKNDALRLLIRKRRTLEAIQRAMDPTSGPSSEGEGPPPDDDEPAVGP